ncbi:Cellular tumor antigen p53 like protein [Argiope bruennichi]|uniref:Cellular tumor antigen p53 like protein n=1 Tax=Argiope bruennichi TaxID=94029 RepID=A0A8T0FV56_ARGBR|nr:Cellular tumor antigen p53 like protein [Argiope bruennichi]
MAENWKLTSGSSEESLPLSQETFNSLWSMMGLPGREEMLAGFNAGSGGPSELSPVPAVQPQPPDGAHVPRIRSSLPATSNWHGNYGFKVTNKLYVRKDAVCPFSFQTNTLMPDDVFVRAMAVYSSPEHASVVVTRCVNHSQKEILEGKREAEHLIRSDSHLAQYEIDVETKRHSVVVPFENPPVGQSYSTYIFRFVCFSSCSGGPNRRPLTLVFTLEHGTNVLGRIALDLKICACPGRDRDLAEREKLPVSSISAPPPKKMKVPDSSNTSDCQNISKNSKEKRSGEKKEFIIKVKDRECYLFLSKMKLLYKTYKTVGGLSPECRALLHILRSSSDEDEKPFGSPTHILGLDGP